MLMSNLEHGNIPIIPDNASSYLASRLAFPISNAIGDPEVFLDPVGEEAMLLGRVHLRSSRWGSRMLCVKRQKSWKRRLKDR